MQLIKTIITTLAIIATLQTTLAQTDPNALAEYYGFEEMEIIKLDWGIKSLTVTDLNGDNRKDIAIVNNHKAKIELLIQKKAISPAEAEVSVDPNDADINAIKPPTRFDIQSVSVSQNIYSFICDDLNSDGMADLAFYGKPKGLYIILQKANKENSDDKKTLSWQTRKKIKIDDGLVTQNALVCADLNNDLANDLALASQDAVYIITQKKDGSLAEPVKYPTTAQVLALDVGDLNADGINDLLLTTNDTEKPLRVRFGKSTGQLGPELSLFIEQPMRLKLVDLDQTVGDEILTIDQRSKRLCCYKLTEKNGSDDDWPIAFYPLTVGEGSDKRDLVIGDFDGDGLTDIVISETGAAELALYRQVQGQGLAEPVKFPAFADIATLSAADIDNDGKAELAALSIKEKVIGLSEFTDNRLSFPKPLDLLGEPTAAALADIDTDGNIDCVYISKDANNIQSLRVIYNLNATTQPEPKKHKAKTPLPEIPQKIGEVDEPLKLEKLTSNPDGIKIIDVDADGLSDVLIFVKYEPPILVRQQNRGEFTIVDSPKAQASLIKEAALYSIAVANVDSGYGDELLIAQKNFARSLTFAEGKTWTIIDQYNAKSTENKISAVAAFNLAADTSAEPAILLLDGQKGQLQILKTGADKTYRFETELDVGRWSSADHMKILFAPLTGGKTKSILLFDSEKFALITPPASDRSPYRLEQQFSYETKIKEGAYGNLTAGDINSDDLQDIIAVEYKRNHIEILALDSPLKPIPAMRFKIFEQKSYRGQQSQTDTEPRELIIADVTNDGKADLITIIHDRLIIYPQD